MQKQGNKKILLIILVIAGVLLGVSAFTLLIPKKTHAPVQKAESDQNQQIPPELLAYPLSTQTTLDTRNTQHIFAEAIVLEVQIPESRFLIQFADGTTKVVEVTTKTQLTRQQTKIAEDGSTHTIQVPVEPEVLANLHANYPIHVSFVDTENNMVVLEQLALLQ